MKIEKLTTREEQRDTLKRKLWTQLEKNGYTKKKNKKTKGKRKRRKKKSTEKIKGKAGMKSLV